MNKKTLLCLLATLLPCTAFAHNLNVGHPIPSATIADKGEILINNGDIAYQNWSTDQLNGKVRVIQAIAGRSAAKEMNAEMMAAITAAKFPSDSYQTTTIINRDDAIWGTGSFVKSSAEDSKRDFSWSSMVLDANGTVQKTWELQPESSAIIVLDKNSTVLFAKEGKLGNNDVEQVIAIVKQHL
ncbi:hypothetical protein ABT56_21485 [Photobacterium aquae]|uniref:YtfJ family protein n=1 Tax=Photobacterium aquae TaxID=1195763 RepID=A0A0J1GS21_9GAMM|nr:YtfJ family protein [Photobacterium aquae]KLV02466.1 hypothetical protein ABT56_21485 [Photobacterium aquae]